MAFPGNRARRHDGGRPVDVHGCGRRPVAHVSGLKTNGLSSRWASVTPRRTSAGSSPAPAAPPRRRRTRSASPPPRRSSPGPYLWQSGKVARPSSRTSSTAATRCRRASPPSGRSACGTRPARPPRGARPRASRPACSSSPTGARRSGSSWPGAPTRSRCRSSPAASRVDKTVSSARLYMSGLGLFEAQLNGSKLTDEVLAPGYTNYQLSAEYRTYDVTSKLRGGANTLGVELGKGTAQQHQDGQPGRRADELLRVVEQLRGRQRDADRAGGGGRHQRQGLERRELLRRRHDQHRHRRRRRPARVAHDHLDRHGAGEHDARRCRRPRATRTSRSTASPAWPSAGG